MAGVQSRHRHLAKTSRVNASEGKGARWKYSSFVVCHGSLHFQEMSNIKQIKVLLQSFTQLNTPAYS
jgi:hypothetical protein